MKKEAVTDLVAFLTDMAHYSVEYALKLKAMERTAKKHPEIFQDYERSLEELRMSPEMRETHERTEKALDKLRQGLLRD